VKVSPARKAAFEILLTVERGQGHSDDLLRASAVSALSQLDRNLATALVLGVLRWQLELDTLIRALLKRPNAKLESEVSIALRLGAFQLLHLDRIPASAAIDESVELTKQSGHRFASAMVNAVLRKVSLQSHNRGEVEPNATTAYPAWMRDRWQSFFGVDTTDAICAHGQSQPALALRIEDPDAEKELSEAGIQLAPGALLTCARTVVSGDVTDTAAFREGRVRIQDEGSQLVAEIAGQGSCILDCCAAPGGKTLILAQRNPDARIFALETSPQRLEALQTRMEPLANRVECRLSDVRYLHDEATYDLVLADVPCSGTGTLGRNPEIRHRLQPEEFARQAERQTAILKNAVRAAKVGGRVVYSTCSLEPEENEQVIAASLDHDPDARVIPLGTRLQEMRGILTEAGFQHLQTSLTREGYLRLVPGAAGTDGFFVAMIKKVGYSIASLKSL
jgi:16S rRNA (cytosine967-C5)-methyltransferase